jgi:hypothetical protein
VLRVTNAATLSSLMRKVCAWAKASAVPCKASERCYAGLPDRHPLS